MVGLLGRACFGGSCFADWFLSDLFVESKTESKRCKALFGRPYILLVSAFEIFRSAFGFTT